MRKKLPLILSLSLAFAVIFPVVACAQNLLTNPGFEEGITGWLPHAGAAISTSLIGRTGSGSAKVTNRNVDYWQGIRQSLLGVMQPGHTYRISGWVMLDNAAGDAIGLKIKQDDDRGTKYFGSNWSTGHDTHWVQLSGYFTLDAEGPLTDLYVYFEGPAVGINFYVDDAVVEDIDVGNWLEQANERIEQIRKTDLQITVLSPAGRPLPDVEIRLRQLKHHFAFGSAISYWQMHNQEYRDFFKDHFEWAVMENSSKWYSNEYNQGQVTYENADAIYQFCSSNDITMRGHCIYWGVDQFVQDWIKALDNVQLQAVLESRMNSVVNHFKGRFVHWDVNNEMLHGSYYKDRLGDSIRTWMFQAANAIDPDCRLFVNDYNIVSGSDTNAYHSQIQNLISSGAPVHGIGVQCHLWGDSVIPYIIYESLEKLATLGLPIWCTEYDFAAVDENVRADGLENFYRIAFSHPDVEGILMWGFWENAHWRKNCHIVNADWTLNEAGRRYEALLREWTTDETLLTDGDGRASFRPFYGTYEVTLTYPGVAPTVVTGAITPDADSDLASLRLNDPLDCAEVHALGLQMSGDLNPDCILNVNDLTLFAGEWLLCSLPGSNCPAASGSLAGDFNNDQTIDLADFSYISAQWLHCNDPQNSFCSSEE